MNRVVKLLLTGGALGVVALASAQQSDETPPPPTPVAPIAAGPATTTSNAPSYSTTVAEANTKLGAVLPPNIRSRFWSSAANGSSNRISRGSITKVRAMQTRCRMPPDN